MVTGVAVGLRVGALVGLRVGALVGLRVGRSVSRLSSSFIESSSVQEGLSVDIGRKPVDGSGVGRLSVADADADADGEGMGVAVAVACGKSVGSASVFWSTESRVSIHMPIARSNAHATPIAIIMMRLRRRCCSSS